MTGIWLGRGRFRPWSWLESPVPVSWGPTLGSGPAGTAGASRTPSSRGSWGSAGARLRCPSVPLGTVGRSHSGTGEPLDEGGSGRVAVAPGRPEWWAGVPVPLSLLSHLGQVADPEWDGGRHALATVSAQEGGAP